VPPDSLANEAPPFPSWAGPSGIRISQIFNDLRAKFDWSTEELKLLAEIEDKR
jgi:hypothetical protein